MSEKPPIVPRCPHFIAYFLGILPSKMIGLFPKVDPLRATIAWTAINFVAKKNSKISVWGCNLIHSCNTRIFVSLVKEFSFSMSHTYEWNGFCRAV